jgi:hypothetical protein
VTNDLSDLFERAFPDGDGEYDRADVERRGRRLVRRRRTLTMLVSAGAVSAVLVTVGVAAGVIRRPNGDPPAASQPTPSPAEEPAAFVPRTRVEGDRTVLPVTFPDGTSAEVVYPAELRIAELGVRPKGGWGTLEGTEFDGCCARDFLFGYGSGTPEALATDRASKTFSGADGRPVHLVPTVPGGLSDYLVFEVGPWRVGVWASMADNRLATWAAHLRTQVGADGFPVLRADAPLRLTEAGADGPPFALDFGAPDGSRQLSLELKTCVAAVSEGNAAQGLSMCKPQWSMWVTAGGDSRFVQHVASGIEIRNVRKATD